MATSSRSKRCDYKECSMDTPNSKPPADEKKRRAEKIKPRAVKSRQGERREKEERERRMDILRKRQAQSPRSALECEGTAAIRSGDYGL